MLDLTTTQASRSLVAIKVMSVYLGVLVASMFFLPMTMDYDYSGYHLDYYWSYYSGMDIGISTLATIVDYIPNLIGLVLIVAAIIKAALLRRAGNDKSIWHSNVVLGAIFYAVAKTAFASASTMSYYITEVLTIGTSYIMTFSLYFLWFSQDDMILTIIALYMAILAWKNYRYS